MIEQGPPLDSLSLLQRLQEYGVAGYAWILLLSFWAGTARYLGSLNGSKPTFLGWVTELVISGFVGILAAMACHQAGLDYLLTAAITGICAHEGTRSIYFLKRFILLRVKLVEPEDEHVDDTTPIKRPEKKGHK